MKHPTLADLTTMRIGGPIGRYIVVNSRQALINAIEEAEKGGLPFFVMGGGSNVIATDKGYDGIIIKNEMSGFRVIKEDDDSVTLKIGAGENWDEIVARTVDMNLSGIEAMSAIPGTVGATPVQNVGAYGQEIADTLVSLDTYDTESKKWVSILAADCAFGYRTSMFKNPATRHHVISHITIRLLKSTMQPPYYASLTQYLDSHGVSDATPAAIRQAVIHIRRNKLPDPKKIPNSGSFFRNPIVKSGVVDALLAKYPHMPAFSAHDGHYKLAAGWLIEQAGLRGYSAYGFKTYEHNALVVVNDRSDSYLDLVAFKKHLVETVRNKFGITLEQEPELLIAQAT